VWLLEVKLGRRWLPLSLAAADYLSDRQMLGWMVVFVNAAWRATEVSEMRVEELVAALRGRQAKVDAPHVLDRCEEAGVCVWADGGTLRVKGPPLTDELRDDLKRCKPELLKLLAEVPPWDEAEALHLEAKVREAHAAVRPSLHPMHDDPFSIAGRNVCADMLVTIARAIAVRRIDLLRRRVDWVLGWFGTLDKRLLDLRSPRMPGYRSLRLDWEAPEPGLMAGAESRRAGSEG
jgi:hypothetical protein